MKTDKGEETRRERQKKLKIGKSRKIHGGDRRGNDRETDSKKQSQI